MVMDPDLLEWREPQSEFAEGNSVMFQLQKSCPQGTRSVSVYSGDLVWQPVDDAQAAKLKSNPPRVVAEDILLARLGPGQEIDLLCKCEKGIGKEHAKWTPVCTAI